MKGCSVFPKAPALLGSHQHCLVSYPGHSWVGGSYPAAEVQSAYSTAPADWARYDMDFAFFIKNCYVLHKNVASNI